MAFIFVLVDHVQTDEPKSKTIVILNSNNIMNTMKYVVVQMSYHQYVVGDR
jgi:hypothetical protein